jgi:hypothetical protein
MNDFQSSIRQNLGEIVNNIISINSSNVGNDEIYENDGVGNSSNKIPAFSSNNKLDDKLHVMNMITMSIPTGYTREQLDKVLIPEVRYLILYNNHELPSEYGNGTVYHKDTLDIEEELRLLNINCTCRKCVFRSKMKAYDQMYIFCIRISINEDYENHGKPFDSSGLLDFRFKYETTMLPECEMYKKHQEFVTFINEMHMKLNGKFITQCDFLCSMQHNRDQMAATVYNKYTVMNNIYKALYSKAELMRYENCYEDKSNYQFMCSIISLFFLKSINIEGFILREGLIPKNEMSFYNQNFNVVFRNDVGFCFPHNNAGRSRGFSLNSFKFDLNIDTVNFYSVNDEKVALLVEYFKNEDKYPLDLH